MFVLLVSLIPLLPLLTPVPATAQVPAIAQAPATTLSQDQILDGLAQRYGQLNSMAATYRRVAMTPSTDQIFKTGSAQTATGLLTWVKPSKLRLEQLTPKPELMLTDGNTVWWYIPSESLAYRYHNINVASQLKPLLSFFGGLDSLKADYQVSLSPADPERPNQYGLLLLPQNAQEEGVDRLSVWCDKQFTLTGFKMTAITGETTDFHLADIKENLNIDSKMFNFKVPLGTEVIEE